MKKILAFVLSLLMILTSGIAVFADDATEAEPVAEDAATIEATEEEVEPEVGPYDLALSVLNKLAVLQGDETGDLMADADVQRYQAATIMARVMTGDTSANWDGYSSNYTTFEDLVDGYEAYNAPIGYCFQKGVINGKSELVYDPAGPITFQEYLKMAVCALGYVTEGIADPFVAVDPTLPSWLEDEIYDDNNNSRFIRRYYTTYKYPYETTEKAIALELTKGITGVALEDALTRGEVAQITYNMLVAINATGTTYINDVFGIDEATIVITATAWNKYYADDVKPAKDEYFSFRLLGEDGAPKGSTYFLPYTALGFEADEKEVRNSATSFDNIGFAADIAVAQLVGKTFTVATSDKFASFLYYFENPTTTLWNKGKTVDYDVNALTIDDVVYTLVEKYTYNATAQGTNSGKPEVIAYKPFGTTATNDLSFYYDRNGNIVDKDGEILLVYLTFAGKYFAPIYELDKDGKKVAAGAADPECNGYKITGYAEAAEADFADASVATETTTANFAKVTDVDDYAYASLEYVDDNVDGIYDRAEYNDYTLAYLSSYKDGDGDWHVKAQTLGNTSSLKDYKDWNVTDNDLFWTADGADEDQTIDLENGTWAIIYVDEQINLINIIDTLTVEYGNLNHYNVDTKSVWIDNEEIPANYANMKGAAFTSYDYDKGDKQAIANYLFGLYRKSVKYIVLDGEVVYLAADGSTDGVVVINKAIGLTLDGTIEVQAYVNGKIGIQTIQIAAIDNYYLGFGFGNYLANLTKGTILAITNIDSNGLYYVRPVTDADAWYISKDQATAQSLRFTPNLALGYFKYELVKGDNKYARFTPSKDDYYVFVNDYNSFGPNGENNNILANIMNDPKVQAFIEILKSFGTTIDTFHGVPFTAEAGVYGGTYYWGNGWYCIVDSYYDFGFTAETTTDYMFYNGKSFPSVGSTMSSAISGSYYVYSDLFSYKTASFTSQATTNMTLTIGWYEVVDGVVTKAVDFEDVCDLLDDEDDWMELSMKSDYFFSSKFAIDSALNKTKADDVKKQLKADIFEYTDVAMEANLIGTPTVYVLTNSTVTALADGTLAAGVSYDCHVIYNNNTGATIVYIVGTPTTVTYKNDADVAVYTKMYHFYREIGFAYDNDDDAIMSVDTHNLIGWSTTKGASVVEYDFGDVIDLTKGDVVLYPVWELIVK